MTLLADVKKLIDASNVSQLARDSAVSRSQLTRIMEGKTPDPGIETVEQILNALGYDLVLTRKEAK